MDYTQKHPLLWFLCAVLLFVNLYSFSTLTTKPAYWYDEAINVELAHNFAEFGKLDLIVAPDTFSERGATVGSTGYPVTVPLAGLFRLFGFGLTAARVYMLLWMSALIIFFFYIARKLWGESVAYAGVLLMATFAPFYGNGRSVMGEIPGFLFFLCAFYFLEREKWWQSGLLLGLAVVSKPSVFVFLIPAFALAVLCRREAWKLKLYNLIKMGAGAILALLPWLFIYAGELSQGGLWANLLAHFKNPYAEAGVSVSANISANLPTLITSTTLLYMWVMLVGVAIAIFLERGMFREHNDFFILTATYLPLALLQYLKSLGYLRYLIAAEFLIFILFLLALPALMRWVLGKMKVALTVSQVTGLIVALMVVVQAAHLFSFADLYSSEKTQKTILYLYATYPATRTVGIVNVPQVASFIPAFQKYQYLSTYGLWNFGTHMLYLAPEKLPDIIVTESESKDFSPEEQKLFALRYEKDTAFTEGFVIYKKR